MVRTDGNPSLHGAERLNLEGRIPMRPKKINKKMWNLNLCKSVQSVDEVKRLEASSTI